MNKKNNKCFQYTVTVALNYEEIKKYPQRITKITKKKPLINRYSWKGINDEPEKDDWKTTDKKIM